MPRYPDRPMVSFLVESMRNMWHARLALINAIVLLSVLALVLMPGPYPWP
jgi:hypothetical protein